MLFARPKTNDFAQNKASFQNYSNLSRLLAEKSLFFYRTLPVFRILN